METPRCFRLLMRVNRKGRRGLVQDQDFGVDGKRLGDLDHLADANIQIFDTAVDVHIYIKALEQLVSLALHAFFV